MKSLLLALCALICITHVLAECQAELNTYSTNDGLVIAEVAHIATFSVKCDTKSEGAILYARVDGKIVPAIRSLDNKLYQVSWTEELSKSSSRVHEIPVYDEEGFAQLRKQQRDGDVESVKALFKISLSFGGTYRGPWLQTELIASLIAVLLWYIAYSAKSKLTA